MGRSTQRRCRSPTRFTCGVQASAARWPESFPAVPCRSPVRLRDRVETQALQQGDLDIGVHASSIVRRYVVQARCRRSGDNSPGSPNLVDPAARRKRTVAVAVVVRVVPPALRRAAQTDRISCSSELFPAVPPAEQDMREVGLPAVEGGAEPGGSACCPQRRVSRACCPQIPVLGPMGRAFLLRFELGRPDERRAVVGGVGAWVWVSRRRGCGCAMGPTGCFMRCRCGSCRRRRTGRSQSVGGGEGGVVVRRTGRRPLPGVCGRDGTGRQGATGNGVGTDMGEAWGRDEQRRDVQRGSGSRRRAAGGSGAP